MKSPIKIEHVEKSHIQSRRTIYQYYYMITRMQHKMLPSESLVLQTKVEKKFLHRNGISERDQRETRLKEGKHVMIIQI